MSTAIKSIDNSIKINIAVAALKNPDATAKELSSQFSVSESTVRRAKKDFLADAQAIVPAPAVLAPIAPVAAEPEELPRGYRPRNGRMDVIRTVVGEMGLDAPSADLYTRVNEVAAVMGVPPIKKSAFYVLICEVRKAAKVAPLTV